MAARMRQLLGSLLALGLLIGPVQAQPLSRVRLSSGPVLEFGGASFDPLLRVEKENGRYRTIIEGTGVSLGADLLALPARLETALDGVEEVVLVQRSSARGQRFTLEIVSDRRLVPQIRYSTPRAVAIALNGLKASTPFHLQVAESPAVVEPVTSPEDAVSHAWDLYRQGDFEEARQALTEHLAQVPDDRQAAYRLALIHLGEDQLDSARQVLSDFLSRTPDFLPGWTLLLRLDLASEQLADARSHLSEARQYFPGEVALDYFAGVLAESADELESAAGSYEAFLQEQPLDPAALYRLAVTRLKQGRPRQAILILRPLMLAYPDGVAARKSLGYAYQLSDKGLKASREYLEALKPDVLINYAALLARGGNEADALTLYEAAEVLAGPDADLRLTLAGLYADIGQNAQAVENYRRFVELAPDEDPRLPEAKKRLRQLRDDS